MCLLYLVAIIIIFLLLLKLLNDRNNNKNNILPKPKCIESFDVNTTTFTKPQNMFLKVLNDINNTPKIVLENVVSKCYLDKNTIEPTLNERIGLIVKDVII